MRPHCCLGTRVRFERNAAVELVFSRQGASSVVLGVGPKHFLLFFMLAVVRSAGPEASTQHPTYGSKAKQNFVGHTWNLLASKACGCIEHRSHSTRFRSFVKSRARAAVPFSLEPKRSCANCVWLLSRLRTAALLKRIPFYNTVKQWRTLQKLALTSVDPSNTKFSFPSSLA